MSCPDWRGLRDEAAGWDDAVAHFDGGCPLCRRAALAAEPTLVFRRLRAAEMSPSQEAAEVDAVRQAVAAMRTASRVDALTGRSRRFRRSRVTAGWTRWAAAAVLAVAALALSGGFPDGGAGRRSAPVAQTLSEGTERTAFAAALPAAAAPTAFTGEADLPTVEGVNRPGARVYHMDGDGLSVVMIVDETLDV